MKDLDMPSNVIEALNDLLLLAANCQARAFLFYQHKRAVIA